MGFPWLKLQNEFADHPKTQALCDELGDNNAGMYLVRLWCWANTHAPTGLIKSKNPTATLERVAHWRGPPGELAAALERVGWLDEVTGGFYLHDWHDHQGRRIAAAQKDAEEARQRREKARPEVASPDSRDFVARPSPDESPTEVRRNHDAMNRVGKCSTSKSKSLLIEGVQGEEPEADQVSELRDAWNELTAQPLPRWHETPKDRRKAALKALGRRPLDEWREVFRRINASAFLRGEKVGGWRASPDWALRPAGAKPEPSAAVLEGNYDDIAAKSRLHGETTDEEFRRQVAGMKRTADGQLVLE